MRIVVVVAKFPELSQTFVLDQIVALKAAGFTVQVVADYRSESGMRHAKARALAKGAAFADRQPLALLMRPKFLPTRLRRLCLRLERRRLYRAVAKKADIVLCHFGPTGLRMVSALGGRPDAPPVWTIFHGYDLSSFLDKSIEKVYEPLFESGARFLPISHSWAHRLMELGCPPDRIRVLRMGVDCEKITCSPTPWQVGEPVRILSVGRLVEKKGIEFSLRALAGMAQTMPLLDWDFQIVGDGPLERDLRQLANELGIENRVRFCGALSSSEVHAKLRAAHIFLLPSVVAADGDMEGIPVALMEAMAAGVPTISTFHSGIPELIEHQVSGLLAPERDADELARHLHRLIENPEMRRSLAEAARRKVEVEFNQVRIHAQFVQSIITAVGNGDSMVNAHSLRAPFG